MEEEIENGFGQDDPLLSISDTDFSILDSDAKAKSKQDVPLIQQIEKVYQLLSSGLLLPDALRDNPYTRPTLIALSILFILLPIKLYLLLLVTGLILGILMNPRFDDVESPAFKRFKALYTNEVENRPLPTVEDTNAPVQSSSKLSSSPQIAQALDALLDRLVTSLVDPWYMNQNKSGQRDFQACVRSTLDAALGSLRSTIGGLGKDSMTLFIYGLTNALNIHMQEYKEFCKSGTKDAKEFLLSPSSLRGYFSGTPAEMQHFRQIVSIALKKLLPKQEAQSIVVISLLKELIAAGAFWNAMDRLCDPDFINMKIVEALKEPVAPTEKLEPGWSLVVLKVIKGKDLPVADSEFYCIVHIAGRKVRTRKVSGGGLAIWNETFQFKVADAVLRHMKLHVQLLQYSYVGQDSNLGYAKVHPDVVADSTGAKQAWLPFKTGQVFVETFVLSGSKADTQAVESSPLPSRPSESEISLARLDSGPAIDEGIPIEAVLQDNELFMEFYEFLNEFRAPPYLPFFTSFDAFSQFTAMELGIDANVPEAIENFFRTGSLTPSRIEQLKMIKADGADLFYTYFDPEQSKNPINISEEFLLSLRKNLEHSDRVDEAGRFVGGTAIGPNIFRPVHKWIFTVLRDVYFDKFKASERFQRYIKVGQHFSSSQNFTFAEVASEMGDRSEATIEDDDAGSTMSMDKDKELQRLSTAISVLKQQLALIENRVESGTVAGSEMEKLLRNKKDLERQVSTLLDLVRSVEADGNLEWTGEGFWLDLRDVDIQVGETTEQTVLAVRVLRAGMTEEEGGTHSLVSKAYHDFERLHRSLRKAFPKLTKVPLPGYNETEELERYMQLLVSDEFIRQSPALRQFLSLDSDLETRSLASNAGHLVEAVVGKRVKSALQTATSILSAGMIGGSSSRSSKGRSHFYETREHHTTPELRESDNSNPNLHRSQSASSLIKQGNGDRKEDLSAKSMPATPVKAARPEMDNTKTKSPEQQIFSVQEFSDSEIEMLMETVYTFITETFDLREPNQWIRRKVLSVSKQLLKQAYGDTLSKSMTATMKAGLQEGALLTYIELINRVLWPNGVFIKDVPPPIRSADQQLATQIEARSLFINKIPDAIERVAGRYNSINGMTRIFNLLQQKDFNKILFVTAIDITFKILFTEQAKS